MRPAPLLVALLALSAAVPLANAATEAGAFCTDKLIESVFVCVGPGRCVGVHTGPRDLTRCAPPACTSQLLDSVGACEDPATGCVTAWVGRLEETVCPGVASTSGAAPVCVSWEPTYACVEPPCVYGSYGYLPFRWCLDPRVLA